MIRKFLVLLLIESIVLSTAHAQTSEAAGPALPAAKSDSSGEKVIKIARRENKVRRGHDAEFAVLLSSPSSDCLECVPALLQEGDHPILTSLQLGPLQGFSYRYATWDHGKFQKATAGKMTYTKSGPAALVKVRADKHLPLGAYTLKGKAELRVFHKGNAPVDKQIDFAIPVELVDQSASATVVSWPYEIPPNRHLREALLEFIMVPLYLPLILVWVIVCSTGHDCSE
jgi:hypothetical protein